MDNTEACATRGCSPRSGPCCAAGPPVRTDQAPPPASLGEGPFTSGDRGRARTCNLLLSDVRTGHLEPVRKQSERLRTLVSFWPALLFRGADMRAPRFRSNHHGVGQDPPDRKCLLNHTTMPHGLSGRHTVNPVPDLTKTRSAHYSWERVSGASRGRLQGLTGWPNDRTEPATLP